MSSQISLSVPLHGATQPARRLSLLGWVGLAAGAVLLGLLIFDSFHGHGEGAAAAGHVEPPEGYQLPPLWAAAPFALLLLCIAVFPLIPATAHWWEHNRNRLLVSLVCAAMALAYYAFAHPMTYSHETGDVYTGLGSVVHVLEHAVLKEYIPFIVLLFSLYVISGGICLRGDLPAHPATNTAFLGVGAILASFIGTTGASMLLIRPMLQTNSERRHVRHTVIFFIFAVSNCGGLLLPIGDPPLFLGYLRGVPFLWTLKHLLPQWVLVNGLILGVYYLWDTRAYRHEAKPDIARDETRRTPLRLHGMLNFVWLLGVVLAVALIRPGKPLPGTSIVAFEFLRELVQLALAGLSLATTARVWRVANQFNYHAIIEVAALFIGIFIAMQIPIEILSGSGDALQKHINRDYHFFWATGLLSSFLDNAPTYMVFFTMADVMTPTGGAGVLTLLDGSFIRESWLTAISLGAVFMGAMTYIGNGPNFMVKSIAEQNGVRMPSFFGYMIYSVGVLAPIFLLVSVLFLGLGR